jgi:hypothetical protein
MDKDGSEGDHLPKIRLYVYVNRGEVGWHLIYGIVTSSCHASYVCGLSIQAEF